MTKELFVTSTPHETKVGLVEDDLLAEIYLERENEYTLAGSIYKGRVTRVLPGMQSAFVDIGLERDAFLYVSDFMELEDSEDMEDVPANQPAPEPRHQVRVTQGSAAAAAPAPVAPAEEESPAEGFAEESKGNGENRESAESGDERDGRGWRGRPRRRRGRGRERFPESKFARPAGETPRETPRDTSRNDYGPPPGYQPIILPGESISKYRQAQAAPVQHSPAATDSQKTVTSAPAFPGDEPLFASTSVAEAPAPAAGMDVEMRETGTEIGSREWERKQKRQHEANVEAVFGEAETGEFEVVTEHVEGRRRSRKTRLVP